MEGGPAASTLPPLEERTERASRSIPATNDTTGEVLANAEVVAAHKDPSKEGRRLRAHPSPAAVATVTALVTVVSTAATAGSPCAAQLAW